MASGYLDVLTENVDGSDESIDMESAATHLEEIDVSLERMNTIIDDILTLARSGEPAIDLEPVEFEEIATAAWETVDTGQATTGPVIT